MLPEGHTSGQTSLWLSKHGMFEELTNALRSAVSNLDFCNSSKAYIVVYQSKKRGRLFIV